MITKVKKYFSFYGMMATSSDIQTAKLYSIVEQLSKLMIPNIIKRLLVNMFRAIQNQTILKPNNI
jgi:hypothetical protein